MEKYNSFRKPDDAWKMTESGIELQYPIFHHDPTIPDDPIIKSTLAEVIGDIDFYAWEGNKEDRIVDSSGKVFIAKFEKKKGYKLFIIPTEIRSGIFPGQVERTMEIEEIKQIMLSGVDRNEIRIKEDKDELKRKILSMNSIQEILKTCSNNF